MSTGKARVTLDFHSLITEEGCKQIRDTVARRIGPGVTVTVHYYVDDKPVSEHFFEDGEPVSRCCEGVK